MNCYRFYKFIDENTCLEVYKGITDFSIDFSPYKTFALPYEPSTAEEFNTKFNIGVLLYTKRYV